MVSRGDKLKCENRCALTCDQEDWPVDDVGAGASWCGLTGAPVLAKIWIEKRNTSTWQPGSKPRTV